MLLAVLLGAAHYSSALLALRGGRHVCGVVRADRLIPAIDSSHCSYGT